MFPETVLQWFREVKHGFVSAGEVATVEGTFLQATNVIGMGVGDENMVYLGKVSPRLVQAAPHGPSAIDQDVAIDKEARVAVRLGKETSHSQKLERQGRPAFFRGATHRDLGTRHP